MERETKSNIRRVMAFTDISGFGKCALSVVTPVLNVMGVEVLPAPTAVLSANMSIPGFTITDMTDSLDDCVNHWESLGLTTEAVYVGYLRSPAQTDIVARAVMFGEPDIVLIDPVMGDGGKLYKSTNPLMKDSFLRLIGCSDVITPNITEACMLAGVDFAPDMPSERVNDVCLRLCDAGAEDIVITGVARGGKLFNCVYYGGKYMEHATKELPYRIGGTGDLFASVLLGALLNNRPLPDATALATAFVSDVMEFTAGIADYQRRGICFEPFLYRLAQ